ncbi:MAG: GNAT family N-acetyltransferase, partial [Candidatus Dormibacterales bacterium]
PISSDFLMALALWGGYRAGAYWGGQWGVGRVVWRGGRPPDELHLHSHILGVIPGKDAQGLGFELKQHQRRWCLERDISVIEWTTDPLVRRNAYFNLTKLGADAPQYLVNFYGEMADGINAGEESDRLLIRWHLASPQAEAAATGGAPRAEAADRIAASADPVLAVGPEGEPMSRPASQARFLKCEVPDDIVALRRTDPQLARRWRLALRAALAPALAGGLAIRGATRSGWYVLGAERALETGRP